NRISRLPFRTLSLACLQECVTRCGCLSQGKSNCKESSSWGALSNSQPCPEKTWNRSPRNSPWRWDFRRSKGSPNCESRTSASLEASPKRVARRHRWFESSPSLWSRKASSWEHWSRDCREMQFLSLRLTAWSCAQLLQPRLFNGESEKRRRLSSRIGRTTYWNASATLS